MIANQFCRYFSTGNSFWQSSKKLLLSKLRKKTGYTFANCKKALELHENDLSKAEEWLKEQAQAHGWSKAAKLQGRSTSQGLIAVMIKDNHGALMEINCETDFVSRNKTFQGLAEVVVSTIVKNMEDFTAEIPVKKTLLDAETLKSILAADGRSLADHVALTIGNLGENIAVKRALCMTVHPDVQLVGCTHPASEESTLASFGRYGALLALKSPQENKVLGMQLCQHIIGMNPSKIGNVEEDNATENADDESVLIHQEFLLDPSLSVHQVLLPAEAELLDFARFEMGEKNREAEDELTEAEPVKTCG